MRITRIGLFGLIAVLFGCATNAPVPAGKQDVSANFNVPPKQMVDVVKHAFIDGQVCDWVRQNVKKTAAEKAAHAQGMLNRPVPGDAAAQARLQQRKQELGLAHRDDIKTFVDLNDADEKRL